MNKKKKEQILSHAGNIFLGRKIEMLALEYVIKNPKITSEELSKVSLFSRRRINQKQIKIKSPTVAQYYIDLVKKYS